MILDPIISYTLSCAVDLWIDIVVACWSRFCFAVVFFFLGFWFFSTSFWCGVGCGRLAVTLNIQKTNNHGILTNVHCISVLAV